jgi:hypothetical protein
MSTLDLKYKPVIDFFAKIGSFFFRINYLKYCLILTTIFILKSGIRGIQPWGDFTPIKNFPLPTKSFSSNSYGLLAIAKLFNIDNKNSFFLLNIILFIVLMSLLYFLIKKQFNKINSRFILLFFIGSPIFVVLTGNIGRHDLLTITGIISFLLVNNKTFKGIFIFIACLGSPEHVLAAFLLYFISVRIYKFKDKLWEAKFALIFSFSYTIISSIWVGYKASSGNRLQDILTKTEFIRIGVRNFGNNFLLEWYTYFGFFWMTLIIAIIYLEQEKRLKILFLILFPIIFNILTVDKTRDFVIAIIPVAILIHREIYKAIAEKLEKLGKPYIEATYGILFYFLLIFPSVEITFEGQPRAPFYWLISKLIETLGN